MMITPFGGSSKAVQERVAVLWLMPMTANIHLQGILTVLNS
jgi:hypothetical protein